MTNLNSSLKITKAHKISRPMVNSTRAKITANPPAVATAQAKPARTAPPVYRPAAPALSAQPKGLAKPPAVYRRSAAAQAIPARTAPPVYRPATPALSAQPKGLAKPPAVYRPSAAAQAIPARTAPSVYRPATPALSAQPKGLAKPPAAYRPFAIAQAKTATTAPQVYRPGVPMPSGMVQARVANNSSSGKAEQPRKAVPSGPQTFWGRPAGTQTSWAVQRAQAVAKSELAITAQKVEAAMAEAIASAKDFARYWNENEPYAAEKCVNKAFELVKQVRMKAEGQPIDWRGQGDEEDKRPMYEDAATKAVRKAINALKVADADRPIVLAALFAEIIGNQVLVEGNNRFAQVLLLIVATKFGAPLPSQQKLANRNKDEVIDGGSVGFNTIKLRKQFMNMYD